MYYFYFSHVFLIIWYWRHSTVITIIDEFWCVLMYSESVDLNIWFGVLHFASSEYLNVFLHLQLVYSHMKTYKSIYSILYGLEHNAALAPVPVPVLRCDCLLAPSLKHFKLFILLIFVFIYLFLFWGDQRTTFKGQFSHYNMQVPEIAFIFRLGINSIVW